MKRPSKKVQVPKSVDLTPEEMSAYETNPSNSTVVINCPNGDTLMCPFGELFFGTCDGMVDGVLKDVGIKCIKNDVIKEYYCSGYPDSGSGDSGSGDSGTIDYPTNTIEACTGKKEGSECSWTGLSGTTKSGYCDVAKDGTLYCEDAYGPIPPNPKTL